MSEMIRVGTREVEITHPDKALFTSPRVTSSTWRGTMSRSPT
jgi:hypothetical protein